MEPRNYYCTRCTMNRAEEDAVVCNAVLQLDWRHGFSMTTVGPGGLYLMDGDEDPCSESHQGIRGRPGRGHLTGMDD